MTSAPAPAQPLVSVVTACFNAEKTIRRTIDSVLGQTYPNIEYLVVDGASTDGTLPILRSYGERITFTSEPDRGTYDAMNKGIRRARGAWIHLVNADDWYAIPDALALAVPQLDKDRTNYFDLVRVYPDREPVLQSRDVSRWMLYIAAFLPHPTLIVAREQYDHVGLYDTELRIASDHDLILRMIRHYPPRHIPIVLSNMDQTGVSARALATSLEEFTQVTIRHGVPSAIARTIQWLKSYWWKLRASDPRALISARRWIKTPVNVLSRTGARLSSPAGADSMAHTPKRVLHLMRTYGAHGGETQLARYFAVDQQCEVDETFAFVYPDPDCALLFERMHARVVSHNLLGSPLPPRKSAWAEVLALLPRLPTLQMRFSRLVRGADICVVHGVQAALIAWPAAMLIKRRVPFVYFHRTTKRSGTGAIVRLLYRPYAVLAGNSQAVAASLAGLSKAARIVCIENGVDWRELEARAALAAATDGHQVIATVGRLIPGKRQALLIEAMARLASDHPNLTLWVVGEGPNREALEALAMLHGIADRVRFVGHRDDVPKLLRAATIFCHASSWEGMSNAVLEAMALGLPSVVCDAPGVTECHVAGETGLVVDGNVDAITAAIETLLNDRERRAAMGAAAAKRIREHYSIEANRRRFLALYAELAGAA